MLVGAHVTANAALDTGRDTLAELGRQRERMEQSRLSVRIKQFTWVYLSSRAVNVTLDST